MSFDPRAALLAERRRVDEALQGLYANFVPSDGLGFGKRVGDGTGIAVERITDVGKQELLLNKLEAIEKAEAALEDGTYGFCSVCGESIPVERLEARPQALTCVKHA